MGCLPLDAVLPQGILHSMYAGEADVEHTRSALQKFVLETHLLKHYKGEAKHMKKKIILSLR